MQLHLRCCTITSVHSALAVAQLFNPLRGPGELSGMEMVKLVSRQIRHGGVCREGLSPVCVISDHFTLKLIYFLFLSFLLRLSVPHLFFFSSPSLVLPARFRLAVLLNISLSYFNHLSQLNSSAPPFPSLLL